MPRPSDSMEKLGDEHVLTTGVGSLLLTQQSRERGDHRNEGDGLHDRDKSYH